MGLLFRVRLHTGLLFFGPLVRPVQSTIQSPSNDHASRVPHAPLTGWPHLIQPGEEFYSKHWVSRRSFRLPHSLSRVPLYPLYPLESPLDSHTHRRASSDPQRGISRILNRRQISGQFPSCSSAIVASFSISRRGDFSGIAWLFLVEIIKPSKWESARGGRRLIRIKGSISP